ncbi:MAG TPA: hypothetical protein VII96_12285 [Acidimicrobiales bacterium]
MKLQTLGDAIDERMRSRLDSLESGALDLGVTTGELLAWLGDERLPLQSVAVGVRRYLGVDEGHYHGLCLRSQMRHIQVLIRYEHRESAEAS